MYIALVKLLFKKSNIELVENLKLVANAVGPVKN